MASAVIQSGFPDWLYFILSVFLCSSQTRSLPRLLFPGAFSPARYAKMHTQCRVSIWAGYEIFKVRVKGKSLNCDSWKFFRNVTLSLIAGWRGQNTSRFEDFFIFCIRTEYWVKELSGYDRIKALNKLEFLRNSKS